jgi:phage-related protein
MTVGIGSSNAQQGKNPKGGKPLSGFGGANVVELVKDYESSTFRVVYTVRFEEVIAVLHAFQKKSHKGKETPKQEIELVRTRLKLAEEMYKNWKSKRGKNG